MRSLNAEIWEKLEDAAGSLLKAVALTTAGALRGALLTLLGWCLMLPPGTAPN
jgi:hypothetical protein